MEDAVKECVTSFRGVFEDLNGGDKEMMSIGIELGRGRNGMKEEI